MTTDIAHDLSGNGFNGEYNNVTLGQPGIGDGSTAVGYNGTTSYTNIYSAGMAAQFNGLEGTLCAFAKMSSAIWNTSTARRIVTIQASGANRVILQKSVANTFNWFYQAGGVTKSVNRTVSTSDWIHVCITWSKSADEVRMYFNGALYSTQTGLGTFVGAPAETTCAIGASRSFNPANYWLGSIAHVALWDIALSAEDVRLLSMVFAPLAPIPNRTIIVHKKDRTVIVHKKDRTVW